MEYDDLELKRPIEVEDYVECSEFVISSIEGIMKAAMESGQNKIIINTNFTPWHPDGKCQQSRGSVCRSLGSRDLRQRTRGRK